MEAAFVKMMQHKLMQHNFALNPLKMKAIFWKMVAIHLALN